MVIKITDIKTTGLFTIILGILLTISSYYISLNMNPTTQNSLFTYAMYFGIILIAVGVLNLIFLIKK